MTKVMIWPAGDENDGTSQYRLFCPAAPLMAAGEDIVVDYTGPTITWNHWWDTSDGKRPPASARVEGLAKVPEADVIVMQRPAERWWADVIPYLQRAGVRVVVDVDDRFDQIDQGNWAKYAYDPNHPERGEVHNHQWVNEACKQADLVTCTTPDLLKRYGHGHGLILPNLVPERYLKIEGERPETIGWSGSTRTHPKDLQVTGSAVQEALDAFGWGFHVIGSGENVQNYLGLTDAPSTTDGWVSFADYPAEMAKMAVGIVPLADTVFNRSKSALKMGEMAAVGVPVVASPTPDNERLAALGVGRLASTPQRWRKQLRALINNPEYRADLAGTGREVMATQTYEAHCEKWWDAWTLSAKRGARRDAAIERLDDLIAAG
jgi:glycosyltransferase involved in cell wall biosynthesis